MSELTGYRSQETLYQKYPAHPGYVDRAEKNPVEAEKPARQGAGGLQKLTGEGFVPLSKEERKEAERVAAEANFSFEGYQVVRREFFSHRYDPTLTIKGNSITFNKACISSLDEVVYVQVLVNPDTEKLVVRPCP